MGKYSLIKENIKTRAKKLIAKGLTKTEAETLWKKYSWKHVDEALVNFRVLKDMTNGR